MKIVERVLERIQKLENIDIRQFGFMLGRGRSEPWFIARRMQQKCRDKKKLYVSFVDIEKVFD